MKNTIQTKRNRAPESGYRSIYAKTGRKRRLNAATATMDSSIDLESDVANVGVGKALFVILVLHVVAIAAIYTHSKFFSGEGVEDSSRSALVADSNLHESVTEKASANHPVEASTQRAQTHPDIDYSDSRYIVVTGDTYSHIARRRNVDPQALRALNGNRPLRAGVVIDLPDVLSNRPVAVAGNAGAIIENPVAAKEIQSPQPRYSRAIEVSEELAPVAIVVKPRIRHHETGGRNLSDSGQRYTVKSGDTVWRISNRFKVSGEDLLSINGISDPRKLGVGREIKIPAR